MLTKKYSEIDKLEEEDAICYVLASDAEETGEEIIKQKRIELVRKKIFGARACREIQRIQNEINAEIDSIMPKDRRKTFENIIYDTIGIDTIIMDKPLEKEHVDFMQCVAMTCDTLVIDSQDVINRMHANKDGDDYFKVFGNNVETVVLGDKITEIPAGAFKQYRKLEKVVGGKNVRIISDYAFFDCKNLAEIECRNTQWIGVGAFAGCENAQDMIFNTGIAVTRIGGAFEPKSDPGKDVECSFQKQTALLNKTLQRQEHKPASQRMTYNQLAGQNARRTASEQLPALMNKFRLSTTNPIKFIK